MDTSRLIAFTQSIVRERSLSGEERAVCEKIAAEMRALGFDRVNTDQNGSVFGVVEGSLPGPTLLSALGWMILGLVVYFGYSRFHSKLQKKD